MPSKKSVKDGPKKMNRKGGPIKKRTKRLDRGKALREMTKSAYEFGKPFVKKAYEVSKPFVQNKMRNMYTRSLKYGQDLGESYRVPRVTNNPSWVDLRKSLNKKLFEMGVTDKEIDIGIYLRGVEAFLKKYEGISFSPKDIKQAGHTLMGKDVGSAMEKYIETALKKGITVKTMIEIFEYLFSHKLSPEDDTEIEMDESREGFSEVKEKKRLEALRKKMRRLELKADTTSRALSSSKLPRDKMRFTGELNLALKAIADHISNEAEDGGLVNEVMRKYNKLVVNHHKKGDKLTNYFVNPLDQSQAQKKKKKKRTKKKKNHKGGSNPSKKGPVIHTIGEGDPMLKTTIQRRKQAGLEAGMARQGFDIVPKQKGGAALLYPAAAGALINVGQTMTHHCVCDGTSKCNSDRSRPHKPGKCPSYNWGIISNWIDNNEVYGLKEGKVCGRCWGSHIEAEVNAGRLREKKRVAAAQAPLKKSGNGWNDDDASNDGPGKRAEFHNEF
jgi:hypothetical protein